MKPQAALALGAVAGPLVLTVAWICLGLLRPGFSLVSEPISGLGVGPNAGAMNAAFILSGLLILAGVAGVFGSVGADAPRLLRWTAAGLLGLAGVGCIMVGLFTFVAQPKLHFLGFLLACGCPVLGFLAAGLVFRSTPDWRGFGAWLLAAGPLTFGLLWLFLRTFDPAMAGAGEGVAGLTERVLILDVHGWLAAMGWLAFRGRNRGAPANF